MTATWIIVIAALLAWIGCAFANKPLYKLVFGNAPGTEMSRDLVVMLGPIGSIMLALCAGLIGYLKLCNGLGKRWSNANSFALLSAFLIPWVGSGAANYVWNARLFKVNHEDDMARDFIVTLGPLGSFMLLLCWLVSLVCKDSHSESAA